MHELGVVFYVVKDVKKVAEENNVRKVSAVTIELGEVSAVIPEYLVEEAELKIERLHAVSFCEDCQNEYPTVEFAKICPHCGSEHTYLIRGNEFNIKEIEVED